MNVLVVDDSASARRVMGRLLRAIAEIKVVEASGVGAARQALDDGQVEVALIDLRLSRDQTDRGGLELVRAARDRNVTPIVVSGVGEMSEVRSAMREGAYDYLLKEELSEALMRPVLEGIRSRFRIQRSRIEQPEVASPARRCAQPVPGLIGASPVMQTLRTRIQRAARSNRAVLVTGPTGSGKELVVRAVHALGPHPDAPLVDLNCGALPDSLMESQLFGHERGSFTGADRRHGGFFLSVGRGTLFLDEIGELPLALQAKLLRVLESGTFRPLGASGVFHFRGRVVAATHVDLPERVAQGRFREDLYYRLNVLELRVPGLAERPADIPALVSHFASQQPRRLSFAADALERLARAPWPGNVRQLRNLVDRIAVFAPESDAALIHAAVVEEWMTPSAAPIPDDSAQALAQQVLQEDASDKLRLMERLLVDEALKLAGGSKTAAARLLGVHRKAVERRVQRP